MNAKLRPCCTLGAIFAACIVRALAANSDIVIRETVLDVTSQAEVSGSRFFFDASGLPCATQVYTVVRLGGAGFPGSTPFRGVSEIIVETPGHVAGKCSLNVKNRDTGAKTGFSGEWQEHTVFKTELDPNVWYQFDDLYFRPQKGVTLDKLRVTRIYGVRQVTAAQAFVLSVDTGSDLHVTDDPSVVSVVLSNRADKALSLSGTIVAVHYFGDRISLPFAGSVSAQGVLRVPMGTPLSQTRRPLGLWRVGATVESEGSCTRADGRSFAVLNRQAVTPRLPSSAFRLGINVHLAPVGSTDYDRALRALRSIGCKLVRGGAFAMNRCWPNAKDLEPDFSAMDRFVVDMRAAGISLNVGCWPNPPWSSPVPESGYRKIIHTRPLKGEMGRYCEKLARHFGTDIDYIETSNEPDLWAPDEFPAADYIDYQKECYEGVKRGCSQILVIPGGFTTADSSHPKIRKKGFQETVMREAKGYYDAHPIHLHGPFGGYENAILGQFFPMREREGVTVPWFPNETGHTLVQGDEDRVAVTVWQKILFSQAHGACDYVWYNLRATRWAPKNAEGGYGLMSRDWYPRAAFASYASLSHVMTGSTSDGIVSEEKGRHLYRFIRSSASRKDIVFAGWDAWGTQEAPLRIRSDAKSVQVFDMMGNSRLAERTEDGRYVFPLSVKPAAILLESASCAKIDPTDVRNVPLPKLKARTLSPNIESRAPDFVLDRVEQATQLYEANPETEHRTWKGPQDLSAKIWIGRSEERLRIRFEVEDDVHVQRSQVQALYHNDGIQFILEAPGQSGNFEFGIAMTTNATPLKALWIVPPGISCSNVLESVVLETMRKGTVTVYDFSVPFAAIGFDEDVLANGFRFNAIVYDDDGMGEDRDGWLEVMPGIAGSKQYDHCPCVRFPLEKMEKDR